MLCDLALAVLQGGLLAGICGVLAAYKIEPLKPMLAYGKTRSSAPGAYDWAYVPKCWFVHFYILHTVFATAGVLYYINSAAPNWDLGFAVVLALNMAQAARRVCECVWVSQWGKNSKMHVTHYVAGVFFYTALDAAPWLVRANGYVPVESKLVLQLVVVCFAILSLNQHRNHRHLACLRKYTLPTRGTFALAVCAHYFDEVSIYALFALLYPSPTYALIFLWVAVNLSVSAVQTRKWYVQKGLLDERAAVKAIVPFML